MQEIHFYVEGSSEPVRLDTYLRRQGVSSRMLRTLKHSPLGIQLNGAHARTIDLVRDGDRITLAPPPAQLEYEPCSLPVEVLWEDDEAVVFNKPADMPCHPSKGHMNDTLANVFAALCAQQGVQAPFRGVYRLDKNTTGVLVAAKTQYAAGQLMHSTRKTYLAIVCGVMRQELGTVDIPIVQPDPDMTLRAVGPKGQEAVTHYEVLARGERYTLVRLRLETGRTHQIRVHMSYIGHPLAGDEWYGGDMGLMTRHALHCEQVTFPHPRSGEPVTVVAKLPEDMRKALKIESLCTNLLEI
ncbi:MAG: RluA family pseudouridine synthase [Oscillospiraceae bacterium]|nr:RluA family pseudouridine synthase [Oscillospiraceae bacterium]